MIELLATAGVTAAWICVFKPIVEDLAKNAAQSLAQDFCKSSLKNVLTGRDVWRQAVVKALKEFVDQFEGELVGAGASESSVAEYCQPLKCFLREKEVCASLGAAIMEPDGVVDYQLLGREWSNLGLLEVPQEFSWSRLCLKYKGKVTAILRSSKDLRAVLDSVHSEAASTATQRMAGVDPGFDLDGYAEALRKRYQFLKLESLDASPDHRRIALTRMFVEQTVRSVQAFNPRVYELPVEVRRRLREQNMLEAEYDDQELQDLREAYLQQPPAPALSVVDDPEQRLCVVLGDPGAGKSVLLEYVAVRWADLSPGERSSRPVPLLIELRTYGSSLAKGDCTDFLSFLERGSGTLMQFNPQSLDKILQRGEASFLLDGLDEVFDREVRKNIVTDLIRYSTRYPEVRFVVSSRTVGHDLLAAILRDAEFQHYVLEDLDSPQRETFIERWHELAYEDPAERAEKQERLRKSLEVAALAELAQNPLLLTLMALLNRHQELPRDRNELYEQASRLLLQQWDATKTLRDDPQLSGYSFDHKDKQAMLRAVALRMQDRPGGLAGNVIAGEELENVLVEYLTEERYPAPRQIADRLIQELRGRNFILCSLGGDNLAFVHRTFLEFFCAWAWVWKFEKGVAGKQICLQELQEQTFDSHWDDERWHEVLRLIAARLEPEYTAQLLEGLLRREDPSQHQANVFLAANCFADVRNASKLGTLGSLLRERLEGLASFEYAHAEGIARKWDGNRWMLADRIRVRGVQALASCMPDSETRKWLQGCARGPDFYPTVRVTAVNELAQRWYNDRGTHALVRTLAEKDQDGFVQEMAMQLLVERWHDEVGTLPLVRKVVESDQSGAVRYTAVTKLAVQWHDDPGTLPLVRTVAASDIDVQVRVVAVRILARWHNDVETLAFLHQLVECDADGAVREAGVKAVAEGWPKAPGTVSFLQSLTKSEFSRSVRIAAVEQMVRISNDDPRMVALARTLAESDDDPVVRVKAAEASVQVPDRDGDTLHLIRKLAHADKDAVVRGAAVTMLAGTWPEDAGTLPLLRKIAASDDETNARKTAIYHLSTGWRNDPHVQEFLDSLSIGG